MTRSMSIRFASSLFLFASLCAAQAATARAASLPDATGDLSIPLAARTANGAPGSGLHSLGFTPNPTATRLALAAPSAAQLAALPASVDLSQNAPPVGDQGSVNSCTSWATGYYLRGWYAKRDGYYPSGGSGGTG